LQEQSQIPTIPYLRDSLMYPSARFLDSLISFQCAHSIFYMTWGWRNGGEQCIDTFCSMEFENYRQMQDTVEAAYMRIANELHSSVAPVGVSWKRAIEADSTMDFWQSDDCHANIYGSYLAACAIYATVFQKNSAGLLWTSSLPVDSAFFLQSIADSVVIGDLLHWIDESYLPAAGFSYTIQADTVFFMDSSTGADYFFWNFGDGCMSTEQNPVHIFSDTGTYVIIQIASDDCDADTVYDTLLMNYDDIANKTICPDAFDIFVFPNPFNSSCNISINVGATLVVAQQQGQAQDLPLQDATIEIFDLRGNIVWQDNLSGQNGSDINDCRRHNGQAVALWRPDESISGGIYLIRVNINGQKIAKRIVFLK